MIKRYSSISIEPEKIKFIDRLVADNRAVALNHTVGLSTLAQVQRGLLSLFALMDEDNDYKTAVKNRKKALYRKIGAIHTKNEKGIDYYHLLDVKKLIVEYYELDFAKWLFKILRPNEALFKLAESARVDLLSVRGFGTSNLSFQVSLANLNEVDYRKIGQGVRALLES